MFKTSIRTTKTARKLVTALALIAPLAISAGAIKTAEASPEWLANATWCANNGNQPSSLRHMAAGTPDGLRGPRSAATMVALARDRARKGQNREAMDFMLACQAHNEHAKNVFRANEGELLSWLRG